MFTPTAITDGQKSGCLSCRLEIHRDNSAITTSDSARETTEKRMVVATSRPCLCWLLIRQATNRPHRQWSTSPERRCPRRRKEGYAESCTARTRPLTERARAPLQKRGSNPVPPDPDTPEGPPQDELPVRVPGEVMFQRQVILTGLVPGRSCPLHHVPGQASTDLLYVGGTRPRKARGWLRTSRCRTSKGLASEGWRHWSQFPGPACLAHPRFAAM